MTLTFSSSECIERPLDIVKYLFELEYFGSQMVVDQVDELLDVSAYFQTTFASEESVNQIPSLNDVSNVYDIPQYSLIRFRSMIQNTGFGHEVFVSSYEIVDRDGVKQRKFHKYSDEIILKDENFNDVLECINSPSNKFSERQLFYCTSVPGETSWAKQAYRQQNRFQSRPEIDIEDIVRSTANIDLNDEKANNNLKEVTSKYPFPKEDHMAAIVKIYEKDNSLKVTDVVEFIGVLNHPRKVTRNVNEPRCEEFNGPCENVAACYIPSVHVIFYRKLHPIGNPLISSITNLLVSPNNTMQIRSALIHYIASAFGGDDLVAEFILLQLLSRVYLRQNGLTLGKFALNISNLPSCNIVTDSNTQSDHLGFKHNNLYAKRVAFILASLLPKYHDLPLTLSTLNEVYYFPHSNNDLDSGVLQVSQSTWFLVDETVLKEGKLCDIGVRNLKTLNDIMDHQKLNYTFPFNNYEFNTDIGIIILSNAKSFLNYDCNIPLIQKSENIILNVPEDTLNQFRNYISILRYTDFNIPEIISDYIQTDYVTQRQNASKNGTPLMTQQDLMLLLNLSRFVGLSFGSLELTKEIWDYTKKLDEARRHRIYQKV